MAPCSLLFSAPSFRGLLSATAAPCPPALTHHHHRPAAPILAHAAPNYDQFSAAGEQRQQQQHGVLGGGSVPLAAFNVAQALPNTSVNGAAVASAYSSTLVENSSLGTLCYIELLPKLSRPLIDDVHIQVKHHDEQEMQEWIETIKGMFQKMTFGEISISAYDTAWVAMVPSLSGLSGPQFPKCLNWIINNQFTDGSWGDKELFLAYDRVCSTVACLVALKTWNVGHENIQKGVKFVQENLARLDHEAEDYMPIGFEVVFPTMLDDARTLDLDLPYDSPVVQKIREEQTKKLKRIPMELLHSRPTTLLHSLEGLHTVVDWKRLLQLQSTNGSFLFSPASTACALRYTGDKKCLNYLHSILEKFNDAVPNVYPVDLFEHLWVVDRLERLGISRYFKREIKQCLDYVFKHWREEGIGWASESQVSDVDDTAMAFRLLRLHGYPVSPDVFNCFKKGEEFFCFEGQTSQAVTGMHNLYRASQTMFQNETILEEAHSFTKAFLFHRHKQNKIQDKWIISNGLRGEVEYTLNNPWYESLPRVEARNYIDHYGVNDIWIGKTLYKMLLVNNKVFLDLAIADYNFCQSFHQRELGQLLRWYDQSQFSQSRFTEQNPVESFFAISATLFEPEYSVARIVWAMCSILTAALKGLFHSKGSSEELSEVLVAIRRWDPKLAKGFSKDMRIMFSTLYNTVNNITQEAFVAQGRDVSPYLRNIWARYVESLLREIEWNLVDDHSPTLDKYMQNAKVSLALEPIVASTILFVGETIGEQECEHDSFHRLMDMVSTIGRIKSDIRSFYSGVDEGKLSCVALYLNENSQDSEVEAIQHFHHLSDQTMRLVVKEYLQSTKLPRPCKQVHFYMAKIINFLHSKCKGTMSTCQIPHYANLTLFSPMPQGMDNSLDSVL
ncbi:hypothetical protein GOP47_0017796 [Adiantum capillus-veneris]|uniref:Uncharacterized protein n=1 Tax=Adiantum capillus-veneris TaxID=13818 RepID=A0A9D4Z9J0_ADICA|nr:hypothetical protein GOP47_0017796 [Adiantum capillus-veneris]